MSSDDTDAQSDTAYCINCGEEIPTETNFCPECGSARDTEPEEKVEFDSESTKGDGTRLRHRLPGIRRENTTRRNVMTGIGYTFGGFVVLGAVGGDEDSDDNSGGNNNSNGGGSTGSDGTTNSEEEYPNAWYVDDNTGIVLRDVEGTVEEFSMTITGDATNESGQNYSYVQLQFGVYDSSEAKVGDALANTSGLDAGQTWRFEAMGTETNNVDSFNIEDITAY